jgi:hypothetical protein
MNKKQLVTVWVGVALMIFFIFLRLYIMDFWYAQPSGLPTLSALWSGLLVSNNIPLIIGALTAGLTCTYANKKPKDEQKQ